MKYVVYGTLGDWRESPFLYDSMEEALTFFDDIHPAYYDHYNIVELSGNTVQDIYTYPQFTVKYNQEQVVNEEMA